MAKVSYRAYASIKDYENDNSLSIASLSVSYPDLARHSLTMGHYLGHPVSLLGRLSYLCTIFASLERNRGRYRARPFYSNAEPSFKTDISFKLGMLAARIVSEKVYKTSLLLHLTDPRLSISPHNASRPDYFAPENNMLIEAKGTVLNRVSLSKAKKAKRQLQTIGSVTYESNQPVFPKVRKVICSCFADSDCLTYCDIDPVETGDTDISFDINRATYLYYSDWIRLLSTHSTNIEKAKKETYCGITYTTFNLSPLLKVGIQERLFDLLSSESIQPEKSIEYRSVQNIVGEIKVKLADLPHTKDIRNESSISQGLDGLLVETSDSFAKKASEISYWLESLSFNFPE